MDLEENWVFNNSVENYFETVRDYERVQDEEESYEFLGLRADTKTGSEAIFELYVGEAGAEVRHETDAGFKPLLKVLDNFYPPQHNDELWIGDQSGYTRRSIDSGFEEDVHTFEFYRAEEPIFDLEWVDLTANHEEGYPAPNAVSISSYDVFGTSLDRASAEPIVEFTLAGLRSNLEEESKGQVLKELFHLLDYGIKADNRPRMLEFFNESDFGEFMDGISAD